MGDIDIRFSTVVVFLLHHCRTNSSLSKTETYCSEPGADLNSAIVPRCGNNTVLLELNITGDGGEASELKVVIRFTVNNAASHFSTKVFSMGMGTYSATVQQLCSKPFKPTIL